MICGNSKRNGNCVCDILAEIADYQHPSVECQGSCPQSLKELVKGFSAANKPNTIPIQLICHEQNNDVIPGTCGRVFLARGFRRDPINKNNLLSASSTWFRVNFVDEQKCCAELELLCTNLPEEQSAPCLEELVGVLFERTGICVTVDLKCFCDVVCFPAVNAGAPVPVVPPTPPLECCLHADAEGGNVTPSSFILNGQTITDAQANFSVDICPPGVNGNCHIEGSHVNLTLTTSDQRVNININHQEITSLMCSGGNILLTAVSDLHIGNTTLLNQTFNITITPTSFTVIVPGILNVTVPDTVNITSCSS